MNYSEKRLKLYLDTRKALNPGLYVQRAGRFKRHPSRICVVSTPLDTGEDWINDVMGEIDNVNEYISIPSGKSLTSFAQAIGRASRGNGILGLCYKLSALQNNLKSAYRYQPQKSTISDHLKDCFGWITEKRPHYKRIKCELEAFGTRKYHTHRYTGG